MHVVVGGGERQRGQPSEGSLVLRENCRAQWIAMMFAQCTRGEYLFLTQQDEVACCGRRVAWSRAGALGMRRSSRFYHSHL